MLFPYSRLPEEPIREKSSSEPPVETIDKKNHFRVLLIGIAIGALFAAYTSVVSMPPHYSVGNRIFAWFIVMTGPLLGTFFGMPYGFICTGWLGLLVIPAHPMRPHQLTAILTLFGLAMWFFAGFLSVIVAVYGA